MAAYLKKSLLRFSIIFEILMSIPLFFLSRIACRKGDNSASFLPGVSNAPTCLLCLYTDLSERFTELVALLIPGTEHGGQPSGTNQT
jgi:hypothetical protein